MRKIIIALASVSALATPVLAQTATATTTQLERFVAAKPTDVLSSNLIGLDITNGQKEDVGEIKDLVISDGALAGYIVSVGGFLGMGEHYVVVSPSAIKVNYSENDKQWAATMDATKDELKAAPQFNYDGRWKK